MKKTSTLTSVQINLEKFKLLIHDFVDGGDFNRKVAEIRKILRVPKDGISTDQEAIDWENWVMTESEAVQSSKKWRGKIKKLDKNNPDFEKKHQQLLKEIPLYFLGYSARKLVNENPDLTENFIDTVREYIKFGSGRFRIPNNYEITIQERNGKKIPTIEIYGELAEHEFAEIMRLMKFHNKHEQYYKRYSPLGDLDEFIKIKKLSGKKGQKILSNTPDLEKDGTYLDESIVTDIMPEWKDTNTRKKANLALIRQKRLRINERIEELFPNTYKKTA